MYKHIIFDFDGTLVDSTNVIITIYNGLAWEYNFKKVSPDEYKMLNNLTLRERFKALNVPLFRFLLIRKISKEFKDRYKKYLDSIHILEGMKELLDILPQTGLKTSIITSNSATNVLEFLNIHGIHSIHEVRASNGLFGKHQTIKKYIKNNQLDPTEVIYIGDELRDIFACKKSKIDVIGVTWGLDTKDLLLSAKPSYLVERPDEIIKIVTC